MAMITKPSQFQNQFEVIKTLGEGSHETKVFHVTSKFDHKSYAIKDISVEMFRKHSCKSDQWKEKLQNEVKTLANLQSKNIVQYYHCWYEGETVDEDDDQSDPTSGQITVTRQHFYIKMELCESDFKKWLETHSKEERNLQEIYTIFLQIMQGLDFIHGQNIIHRDIKPANIMLKENGANKWLVKIGDFGLSTLIEEQNEKDLTTRIGTSIYRSPEMCTGCSDYDFKTDIFSSGLVLFESIHVFTTKKYRNYAFDDIQEGKYRFPSDLPELNLIKKLTEFKSEKRPTAKEVYKLLTEKLKLLTNSNLQSQGENSAGTQLQPSSSTNQSILSDSEQVQPQYSSISQNGCGVKRKLKLDKVKAHELASELEHCKSFEDKLRLQGILKINNGDFEPVIRQYNQTNLTNYGFCLQLFRLWISKLGSKATVGLLKTTFEDNKLVDAADLLDNYDETTIVVS